MVGGYSGTILRVDLSLKKIQKIPLNIGLARKFIGGRGLAAKILFDEINPKIGPFSPENIIIFATGPVTGVPVHGANRTVIVTKSPETNIFLDTYAGGNLGPEIKFAGYDAIIVRGKSEKPVYIQIVDDEVSIKNASHIWGRDCWEAETILKEEVGDKDARVAVIGPAGENMVKFACVSTDYCHQFGRGGAGAVMGSKNLKGIVIKGTKSVHINQPEYLLDFLLTAIESKISQSEIMEERIKYGTPLTMDFTQEIGILPTKNYQFGRFDGYEEINCYAIRKKLKVLDKACYCCNLPCVKLCEIEAGPYRGTRIGGPEYETLAMLGSNIGNSDLESIVYANTLCDRLGLDTISTGNVIGFAMECYEKGLLAKEELDGLNLKFGNIDAALELIRKIALREGVGNLLAEGVKIVSQLWGKGSEFAMHAKGLEYPAYDPRGSPAFALFYAIADRGACHRRGWPLLIESRKYKPSTTEGRPQLVKILYDKNVILHCMLVCDMPYNRAGIDEGELAKILSAVTGWELSVHELSIIADRVASLIRSFNVRECLNRSHDRLATRTIKEPLEGKCITEEMLDEMLKRYYELRGWDVENGIPLTETLKRLDLYEVIDELKKVEKLRIVDDKYDG